MPLTRSAVRQTIGKFFHVCLAPLVQAARSDLEYIYRKNMFCRAEVICDIINK